MTLQENNGFNKPLRSKRKRKEINYKELDLSNNTSIKEELDDSLEKDEEWSVDSFYGLKKNSNNFKMPKPILPDLTIDEDVDISEYEKKRLKNVAENRKMMIELGLLESKEAVKQDFENQQVRNKIIKKKSSFTPSDPKRSLRLQGKTPTGEVFTPIINDSPKVDDLTCRSRKVEAELSMAIDESCGGMLDRLRTCLSSSTSSSSSSVDTDSLIDDMRWLNLAAAKTKVVNKRIQSLCVHPIESKLLILAGSIDGTLGLWDVGSDSSLAEFEPHIRAVNCISISSTDHSKLFSTSHDGTVRRADIQKGTFDLVYQTDENTKISHITWHCELDKHTLLVAHGSGVVGVVDIRIGYEHCLTRSFVCHDRSVRTVQLHPIKSQYFLTSSGTGEAKIFDIRHKHGNADHICNLIHDKGLTSAFFSPDSNKVLTTCNDDRLRVFNSTNLNKPKEAHQTIHDNHTGRWLSVFKARWHPTSSDFFVVGSMQYPKRVQIYNGSCKLMREIKSEDLTTICPVLDVHATQSIIAGGDSVGRVYIFTTQTHRDRLKL